MAGKEYFSKTAQTRDHAPVNTMRNDAITHFRGADKTYSQPRIIFWSLTQAKYHQTRHQKVYTGLP